MAQHPHWKGFFTLEDMTAEDLEAISNACLDHDDNLLTLYENLVPGKISHTTFWTSYLSHIEYYLSRDSENQNSNNKSAPDPLHSSDPHPPASSPPSDPNPTLIPAPMVRPPPSPANEEETKEKEGEGKEHGPPSETLSRGVEATAAAISHNGGYGTPGLNARVANLISKRLEENPRVLPEKKKTKSSATVGLRAYFKESKAPLSAFVAVWRAGVIVREGPSIEAQSIGSIPYGEAVTVTDTNGRWVQHELGWSCTTLGKHKLLEEIPRALTPYGPGFLCHIDSRNMCKLLLASFGARAYVSAKYVQVPGVKSLRSIKNIALDASRLVHLAKADQMTEAMTKEEDEKVDAYTGMIVGLLQTFGVLDDDYDEIEGDIGPSDHTMTF
uniref:BSD domain-containing protein n=1 Tax=Amorphochlora amoebiformis TaxID=1561963 RepID=A0A7S0DKS3_9EUKA